MLTIPQRPVAAPVFAGEGSGMFVSRWRKGVLWRVVQSDKNGDESRGGDGTRALNWLRGW